MDKVNFATIAFQVDFAKIGNVQTYGEDTWNSILSDPTIDPGNTHKRFGCLLPECDNEGIWTVKICPEVLVRRLEEVHLADVDEYLLKWCMFWVAHLQFHIITEDWAMELDAEHLTSEAQIAEEFEANDPELYHFGVTLIRGMK